MINFKEEIIEILNDRQFLVLPGLGALEVSYPDLASIKDLDNIPKYISINGIIDQDIDEYLFNYINEKTGRNFEDINENYQPFKEKLVIKLKEINPSLLEKDGKTRVISQNGFDFLTSDNNANNLNTSTNSSTSTTANIPSSSSENTSENTSVRNNYSESANVEPVVIKKEEIESPKIDENLRQNDELNYSSDEVDGEYENVKPKRKYWWALIFSFLVSVCLYFYYYPDFLNQQIETVKHLNLNNSDSLNNKDSSQVTPLVKHYFLYAGFFNSEQKAIDLCKYFNDNNIDTYVVQIDSMYAIKGDFIDENQSMLIREKIKRLSGLDSEIIVENE